MLTKEYFEQCNVNRDTKVAVISHNDLDGVGPIIIAKNYFNDCKYFTVANSAVNKVTKLVLFAPEYADREVIFITDVSVSDKELIDFITRENVSGRRKIMMFDHHGTALYLNAHDWVHVTEEVGVSGTKLFWQYMQELLADELATSIFLKLDNLVEAISDYDTWQWVAKGREESKLLSELYSNTGVEYFITKYTGSYLHSYKHLDLFNDVDKCLLRDFETKFKYLIWPAVERSARIMEYTFTVNGHEKTKKVKCVTVSNSIGDLAERLYEDGIDTIFFFYHDTLSVRSQSTDVDLGVWAQSMAGVKGGGGHAKSAGFSIDATNFFIYQQYLDLKFEL